MTHTIFQGPAFPEPDIRDMSAPGTPSGKSVWVEPTLTRMDISQSQTVFNATPDGDTMS